MKIWRMDTDANNYDYLVTPNDEEAHRLVQYGFDGRHLSAVWDPIEVVLFEEKKHSDTPTFFAGAPVLSERAVEELRDLIEDSVEILPLKYDREKYFAINIINVISALNYSRAEFIPFPNSNRIMMFTKYAFLKENVRGQHIFKINESPESDVFISDELRNRIISRNLEGFQFESVWDSEQE